MSRSSAVANVVNGGIRGDVEIASETFSLGSIESDNIIGLEIETAIASRISDCDDCTTQSSRVDQSTDAMRAPLSESKFATPDEDAHARDETPVTIEKSEESASTSGVHRSADVSKGKKKTSKLRDVKLPKFFKGARKNRTNTSSVSMRDRLRASLSNTNSKLKSICETPGKYGKNYVDHVGKGFKITVASAIVASKVLQIPFDLTFRASEVVLAAGLVAAGAAVSATTGTITLISLGNVDTFTSEPFKMACGMARSLVKDAMPFSDSFAGEAANNVAMLFALPVAAVVGGSITLVASLGTAAYATATQG